MNKYSLRVVAICLLTALLLGACAVPGNSGENTNDTEGTMDILQKRDPADDDTLNILMIGNSFCYYYPDELYSLAQAAGIKIRVCNVYYSGCKLEQHWTWWKNNEANYQFFTFDENGRQQIDGCNLEYCLQQQNWDVISLQEASSGVRESSAEEALAASKTYRTDLITYIQEQFPKSQFYWHQTWAYQVGYDRNGYAVTSAQQQAEYAEKIKTYTLSTCEEFGLKRVNTGEAWQLVRESGYDNLCARLSVNGGEGDYYHDGDIGGGQYLNACVWFEVLTGQSCIGNTFRPSYTLTEEMVATLQQAAHEAVANLNASAS